MDNKKKRILMSIIGVAVCGVSVGFFKRATYGVDPFQSLMSGLSAVLPISFGTLYVLVNICLLLFSVINDKSKIGIATLINLFLLGYIADFSHNTLLQLLPDLGYAGRAVMLIIGIVAMCVASSFYFTADMGVSTYDAVSLVMAYKWKLASFKVCRIGCDLCCVVIGLILFFLSGQDFSEIGQVVGIGTIVTAFFMGPLIEYFNIHIARPFLNK